MIHADVFERLVKQRFPEALVRPFGATVEVRITTDLWRQSDSGWLNQVMNDTDCTLGGFSVYPTDEGTAEIIFNLNQKLVYQSISAPAGDWTAMRELARIVRGRDPVESKAAAQELAWMISHLLDKEED